MSPASNKREIVIVVASPGDVHTERKSLESITADLNAGLNAEFFDLRLLRWETDSYPGFHPAGAQGVVDQTLPIADCDVLIVIFWRRFGTPTPDAQSGTEHEFWRAYDAWKTNGAKPRIMVYFRQSAVPMPQNPEDIAQLNQVVAFKKSLDGKGLYWEYQDVEDFRHQVSRHLQAFLKDLWKQTQFVAAQSPAAVPAATSTPISKAPPEASKPAPPPNGQPVFRLPADARDTLRLLRARSVVLAGRFKSLETERQLLGEARYAERHAGLVAEHAALLRTIRKLLAGWDPDVDRVLAEAIEDPDPDRFLPPLTQRLRARQVSIPAFVPGTSGLLAAALIGLAFGLADGTGSAG